MISHQHKPCKLSIQEGSTPHSDSFQIQSLPDSDTLSQLDKEYTNEQSEKTDDMFQKDMVSQRNECIYDEVDMKMEMLNQRGSMSCQGTW